MNRRYLGSHWAQVGSSIGMVEIYAKHGAILAGHEAAAFRKELYKFARKVDAGWSGNPDCS